MSPTVKKIATIVVMVICAAVVWRWFHQSKDSTSKSEPLATNSKDSSASGGTLEENRSTSSRLLDAIRKRGKKSGQPLMAGRGRLRGVVVDAVDRNPVDGVDVLLGRGDGEETVTSDDGGKFSLELGAGAYDLKAIGDRVIGMPQPRVTILPDREVSVTVIVHRLATIRGTVRDYAGAGVRGASVHFIATTPAEKALTKTGLLLSEVPTDESGRYEIDVLPQKNAIVEARRGFVRTQLGLLSLKPAELREGVDFQLSRGVKIEGTVIDAAGRPVVGADVSASSGNENSTSQLVKSVEAGAFSMAPMSAGNLVVEARVAKLAPSLPIIRKTKGGETLRLTLRLQPSQVISGVVVDEDGNPLDGVRLRLGRGGSRMKALESYSGSKGEFELTSVDEGKYWLAATKGGLATTFKERVQPPDRDLKIILYSFGGIKGTVTSAGKPVAEFVVEIVSIQQRGRSRPRPSGALERFRSASGSFEIGDLEPGKYQLLIRGKSLAPAKIGVEVKPSEMTNASAVLAPS